MYPSGAWRGYWEQVGWSRQTMHDLVLHFTADTVRGEGSDVIGPFAFHGTCTADGTVTVRDRDTLKQDRVAADRLVAYLAERLTG